MVRRHNRALVAFHVATDAVLGMVAFFIAYLLRFETGLIAITRGHPPVEQYVNVLPFVALIVPLGFYFQGLYRLRRGRSRIDDFFNVLVGSIFAVVLGVVATLYFQAYYATDAQRDVGAYEVSRVVWGIFLFLNIALGYLSRKFIREALERRWLAGIGLRKILIAGAGDLGRVVADRILEHRELGSRSSALSTTRPAAIISAIAACRCSARWPTPPRSSTTSKSTICMWRCRSKST